MRRPLIPIIVLAAVLAAGCLAPAPCTRALCPTRVDGSYRVEAWSGSSMAGSGVPAIPVVSDSRVEMLSGEAEFSINSARIKASAGTSFRFELSTAAVPSITVSSGSVEVALSSAPSATVSAGRTFLLKLP